VRETCWKGYDGYYHYKADYLLGTQQLCKDIKVIPSIHMPKEAVRIFLRVTNLKCQRLWEITEQEAEFEGCSKGDKYLGKNSSPAGTARQSFMWLWQKINDGRDGCEWANNPCVWVYQFERFEVE
jgi:hypothetical protein